MWESENGEFKASLSRDQEVGEKENEYLKAILTETKEPKNMELFNIKTFFSFPKYLIALSAINNELICLGNSKDLGMFAGFNNHLSQNVCGSSRESVNPESMGKKSSFLSFQMTSSQHREVSRAIRPVHFYRGERFTVLNRKG